MSDEETASAARLLEEHGTEGASFTRRDPGETGPVLVQFADGKSFVIDGDTVEEA